MVQFWEKKEQKTELNCLLSSALSAEMVYVRYPETLKSYMLKSAWHEIAPDIKELNNLKHSC